MQILKYKIDKTIQNYLSNKELAEELEILKKLNSFIESFLSIKIEDLHFMLKAALLSDFQVIIKEILSLQLKRKRS